MEPESNLEALLSELGDTITISNPGGASGTITSTYPTDTITLSGLGATYSNTTVTSGGYTVPPSISISAGTGLSSPWTVASTPWLGAGISTDREEGGKLILEGENADVEINGESLMGLIRQISERLRLLKPNEKLESEWEELRVLGEKYRELEKHILEKQAVWDRLKAMPPPDID